jgi:outer membrane receptor protein involved in Fe transport
VLAADDRLRVALTLGADRSGNEQGSASGRMAAARVEVERRIAPPLRARFGSSATLTHYDAGVPAHGPSDITLTAEYPEHEDLIAGAYADVVWRPNPRLEIVPGLRADLYTWRRLSPVIIYDAYGNLLPAPPPRRAVPALDPRLAARFTVHPRVAVFAQIAQAHQGPSFYVPVPGVEPSSFPSGLQSALQTSAGVEVALPAEITATATGFRNTFDNVNDFGTCTLYQGEIDVRSGCLDERRSGQAYGLEVFVRRPLTRAVGGWISYTLSRTEDEFPTFDFGKQATSTRSIPTPFDRTHVVNVVASCDLGRGWRAGARLLAYSGAPYYIYDYLGVYRSANLVPPTAIPSNLAIDRFPWFYRVDLRLEKRWPLGRTGYLAVVAEGLNVTLQREPINVSCGADGTACSPVMGSPFAIPSIGVEGAL